MVDTVFEIAENDQRRPLLLLLLHGNTEIVPQMALGGGHLPQPRAEPLHGESLQRFRAVNGEREPGARRTEPGRVGPAERRAGVRSDRAAPDARAHGATAAAHAPVAVLIPRRVFRVVPRVAQTRLAD